MTRLFLPPSVRREGARLLFDCNNALIAVCTSSWPECLASSWRVTTAADFAKQCCVDGFLPDLSCDFELQNSGTGNVWQWCQSRARNWGWKEEQRQLIEEWCNYSTSAQRRELLLFVNSIIFSINTSQQLVLQTSVCCVSLQTWERQQEKWLPLLCMAKPARILLLLPII